MAERPRPTALRLGRVLGVPVYVMPSWFLLAGLLVLLLSPPLVDSLGATSGYAITVSFAVLLGISVLLHEIGHCVVARAYGLPVRSITITFLAGFTEIVRPPQTPEREYAVAVAGPLVSLLLTCVGFALIPVLGDDSLAGRLALNLALTNGLIAVLNLLPGLPLDGGRVLRAVLWRLSGDPHRATRGAAWSGRVLGAVVLPLGLLVGLPALGLPRPGPLSVVFAAVLGGYVYALATLALKQSRVAGRLTGMTAGGLARPAMAVAGDLPVAEAVRRAQLVGARGLVVVDAADRPAALVSEAAVMATPEERRPWVTVGTLSRRLEDGLVVEPGLGGAALVERLRATPASEYLVRDPAGGPLAVLVAEDLGKALSADR